MDRQQLRNSISKIFSSLSKEQLVNTLTDITMTLCVPKFPADIQEVRSKDDLIRNLQAISSTLADVQTVQRRLKDIL